MPEGPLPGVARIARAAGILLCMVCLACDKKESPTEPVAPTPTPRPSGCSVSAQDDVPNNNNSPRTALAIGTSRTAELNAPRDSDWFLVTLGGQQEYVFSVTSTCIRRPTITVRATSGQFLAGNDPSGSSATPTVSYRPNGGLEAFVVVQDWSEQDIGSYTVSAAAGSSCTASAQDDVPSNANSPHVTLAVGGSRSAELNDPRDSDWFLVTLSAQQGYVFSISSQCIRRPTITIRSASGQFLAGNDPSGSSATPTVGYRPSSSMEVFAVVQDWGEVDVGRYTISAARQ